MESTHKRRRTSSGDIKEKFTLPAARSTAIWFEDGNIILQAENIKFRVHKSVLALHSSVLCDMLMVAKPDAYMDSDLFEDGCPVVQMKDDLASEWEELLSLIYHGYKKTRPNDALSFSQISAMLRLGHKYCFRSYRQEALDRFVDALGPDWDTVVINDQGDIDTDKMHMDDAHSWSDVVNLTFDLQIRQALPLVCFNAIAHKDYPSYLFEGTKSKNGTISRVHPAIQRHLLCTQDNLFNALRRHSFSWFFDCDATCGERDCESALICCIERTYTPKVDVAKGLMVWEDIDSDGLCEACKASGQATFEAGRNTLWAALPSVFGLPPWDTLDGNREDED
ncbi:hypothetical protein NMY22_g16007 [Coprinellus aureogranulatus]|nr:hypothetical protein NMY22_g16007 [Coprinellus aureogranulatus]